MRTIIILGLACLLMASCAHESSLKSVGQGFIPHKIDAPVIPFSPRHYICYRAGNITIDGDITDAEWSGAPWSELFTDIEGDLKPAPLYDTRMKMLWDDKYMYIAAELKEPHIWATLRQRDTVIFYDNDFEVFIDPDGDTHGYYEFEMNAWNTVWDLMLTMPYRDYGKVIDSWNINGLMTAVKVYGTINDPSDTDDKWTVELAFPFDVLKEWGNVPAEGKQWRVNFSRVNWRIKTDNGRYVKETDPSTGKPLSEFNWLWSPQGIINIHYPEMWGFVQFSAGDGRGAPSEFIVNPDEMVMWELRRLYYAQRAYAEGNKRWAGDAGLLSGYGYAPDGTIPEILITMSGYEASLPAASHEGFIFINNRGQTWASFAE